ncbi:glucosamine--fructose-6-phosphate aminotransferase (isomerizing) [Verrucomicrobium sp. GAS474]|uniref:glutamine--fructose-6-phosphate transaminase (isomerizing) n=1 Tax=Verrucomicrobium sp. GAS474 TaxID=1882831 RepID=UPI00087D0664|nr:glutamine--fructose-6-phosphate transaminase (isomerizing) [Verrucomicrobium sp. GAS474]SDT95352.1 glucosamine--fructose-6-phosphate aminotransferase (isomerizing) [Verrucomicrobium sp. GAS474]
MCGIVAYLGEKEAQPLLLDGLRRLEYRGYDSSGIATLDHGVLKIAKKKGHVQALATHLSSTPIGGKIGISHTRWATHGAASDANAHPHTDQSGRLAIVHNGVVENYLALKHRLTALGHTFKSETDTEILAHLIGHYYDACNEPDRLLKAVRAALREVSGTYGIAVLHQDHPGLLVGARRGSPLLIGIAKDGHFFTSDVMAIGGHAGQVIELKDGDIATITADTHAVTTIDGGDADFIVKQVEASEAISELGSFPHYMLKEVFDQPQALRDAFRGRLDREASTVKLGGLRMTSEELRRIERIVIVGCGTARHSGLVGEYLIETLANLPVEVEYASEFRYRNTPMDPRTLVFAVSQSGETLDTLGALREAQRKGYRALGICNRVGSTMPRESDGGVYMHAGPEIGVAATKSFTSQVMIFTLIALLLGRMRYLSAAQGQELIDGIEALPGLVEKLLAQNDAIKKVAEKYHKVRSMIFLGRLHHVPVAMEGALKMKEITYINAEGYPAAELKHGIIALIDEETPTVLICPKDSVYDKNASTLQEIKARKGPVIAVATEGDTQIGTLADDVLYIPDAPEILQPILASIPLQLFAYHCAVLLGRDVDKPRNLAKSVTVE